MALYDASVPLRPGMPTYAGEPGPHLDYLKRIANGDSANVSALSLGSHTGTHVDAPHHFLDGRSTVEAMPVDALVGPADVVELTEQRHIIASDLEKLGMPTGMTRVLLKTPNSRFWDDDDFHADFVGLTGDAARWLVERRFVLVGIDYLSIEQFRSRTHEVHKTLLEAGVIIVEGLDLRRIPAGAYTLLCAPLKVVGADGAPARVFLWD
ncbi:MAG: cyclase family protein [Chloroflexi bacterium]|nr:MAG: cyclase family protein [Chloroflexota bacterium]